MLEIKFELLDNYLHLLTNQTSNLPASMLTSYYMID